MAQHLMSFYIKMSIKNVQNIINTSQHFRMSCLKPVLFFVQIIPKLVGERNYHNYKGLLSSENCMNDTLFFAYRPKRNARTKFNLKDLLLRYLHTYLTFTDIPTYHLPKFLFTTYRLIYNIYLATHHPYLPCNPSPIFTQQPITHIYLAPITHIYLAPITDIYLATHHPY